MDDEKFIVTFDDGLKEHFKAAEMLSEKGIQSIFSIIGSPRINSKDSLIGTNPKQPIDEVINREVRMSVNTLFVTFIEQCESIHMLETNV